MILHMLWFEIFLFIKTLLLVILLFFIKWYHVFDSKTCPWMFLRIFCGPYLNQTYRFGTNTYWRRIKTSVPDGCLELNLSMNNFYWRNFYFSYIIQVFILIHFNHHWFLSCDFVLPGPVVFINWTYKPTLYYTK